jgi:Ca2+-binding RTX toxin-like protein
MTKASPSSRREATAATNPDRPRASIPDGPNEESTMATPRHRDLGRDPGTTPAGRPRPHRRSPRLEALEERIVLWNTYVSLGDATAIWPAVGVNFRTISYSYSNMLDGWLDNDPLRTTDFQIPQNAIEEAMGVWSGVAPLRFEEIVDRGPAVSDALYTTPELGDTDVRWGHHFIDGTPASGLHTLAHGYRPGTNGRNGDVHFDDGDTWTFNRFLETATHELGHALGMAHANGDIVGGVVPAAIPAVMDAAAGSYSYNGRESAFLLQDDVDGIQSLYGAGLGYVMNRQGELHIYGTRWSDTIVVDTFYDGSRGWQIRATSNTGSFTRTAAGVRVIEVHGLGGNDFLRVESNAGIETYLWGGDGDDSFDLSLGARNLSNITGFTTVWGGAGTDRIFVYDDNSTTANAYAVTEFSIQRPGFGGVTDYNNDVEAITLRAGRGVDTVNVRSTSARRPLFLNNSGGRDTVNIGSSFGVSRIRGAIEVQNDPSYTTLNINDTGSNVFHDVTIDRSGSFGFVDGLAPARISWDIADVSAVNITTGSGWDKINVRNNAVPLTLDSAQGLDEVTLGRNGNMREITGPVTIMNNSANTIVEMNNVNDTVGRSVSVTSSVGSDGYVYDAVAGLAPALIRYRTAQTLFTNIRTGGGTNAISVTGTSGSTSIVGRGTDTVTIGLAGGSLAGILGPVGISNPTGSTALVLNDAGDRAPGTITISESSVTGLAPANIGYAAGDLRLLSIYAGSGGNTIHVDGTPGGRNAARTFLSSGAGSDAVYVKATTGALEVSGAGGIDAVRVGRAGRLDGIAGAVHVSHASGRTILEILNDADTTGRTATLNLGRLTWTNYAAPLTWVPTTTTTGGVTYVQIDLGLGSDTLTADRVDALYSSVYLRTGAGNDKIQVKATSGGGGIYLDNQGGTDTHTIGGPGLSPSPLRGLVYSFAADGARNDLILDGSGSSASLAMRLAASTAQTSILTGFAPAPIYYDNASLRSLAITSGAGADTLTLAGLRPGINYRFNGGGGSDRIVAEDGTNRWNLDGPDSGSLAASFPTEATPYSYTLAFTAVENLRGGAGADTLQLRPGASLAGTFDGGAGQDVLTHALYGAAATVNLQTLTATGVGRFAAVEKFVGGGTAAATTLVGTNAATTWSLTAAGGGTVGALAFSGMRHLTGGSASDVFRFSGNGSVAGTIDGGGGSDTLDYSALSTSVTVNLGTGDATRTGGVLGIENALGGSGDDTLTGNAQSNILSGGRGNDTIDGGGGRDLVIGGLGADRVRGGDADDLVVSQGLSYDTNLTRLLAVMAEWTRTDLGYAARVANLRDGGGLNGTTRLNAASLVDDAIADLVIQGGTGRDWFLVKRPPDAIADLAVDEQVN